MKNELVVSSLALPGEGSRGYFKSRSLLFLVLNRNDIIAEPQAKAKPSARGKKSPNEVGAVLDAIFSEDLKRALQGRLGLSPHKKGGAGDGGAAVTTPIVIDTGISRVAIVLQGSDKEQAVAATRSQLRQWGGECAKAAMALGDEEAVVYLPPDLRCDAALVEAFAEGVILRRYKFEEYQTDLAATKGTSGKSASSGPKLQKILLLGDQSDFRPINKRIADYAQAYEVTRNLVNRSACDCTPTDIVAETVRLAKERALVSSVFDQKKLARMGANSFLSVARGSSEPGFIAVLKHNPPRARGPKVAIIGKGITFDSGGYSLKPADSMNTMKIDMAGAAAVIGAMELVAGWKIPLRVTAYIPTCENMVSGIATRPGDVVKSLSGKTIEILNTDAEGRLILADAITMAAQDGADVIVDIATLTGACMVALGAPYAGLFTEDEELCRLLQEAGEQAGERLWRLPLGPEYRAMMKSQIADISNQGITRYGGASSAASFLREFVPDNVRWAHLDIAGCASVEKASSVYEHGATGFGVGILARFLERFAAE